MIELRNTFIFSISRDIVFTVILLALILCLISRSDRSCSDKRLFSFDSSCHHSKESHSLQYRFRAVTEPMRFLRVKFTSVV
jgi:hypothetical protein